MNIKPTSRSQFFTAVLTLSFLVSGASAHAQAPVTTVRQERTLFSGSFSNGGYGGPVQHLTTLNGKATLLLGGEGGWIINHRFILGGGGFGTALQNVRNDGSPLRDASGRAPVVEMGYGGVLLGYVHQPARIMHLAIQTLIGGGGVSYHHGDALGASATDGPSDAFFVAEPGAHLEVNVTRNFRLKAGGSYRFVSGVRLEGLTSSDLRGPAASLTLKFGRF